MEQTNQMFAVVRTAEFNAKTGTGVAAVWIDLLHEQLKLAEIKKVKLERIPIWTLELNNRTNIRGLRGFDVVPRLLDFVSPSTLDMIEFQSPEAIDGFAAFDEDKLCDVLDYLCKFDPEVNKAYEQWVDKILQLDNDLEIKVDDSEVNSIVGSTMLVSAETATSTLPEYPELEVGSEWLERD